MSMMSVEMSTGSRDDGSNAGRGGKPVAPGIDASAGQGTLAAFTLTTFLSALLLFSIQPMFAKMVLPVLGGSPSVWAVALLFFQGVLLAGYCYAHGLIRFLPLDMSGLVHLALCAAAFLALPIALPEAWAEPPPGDPYLWQLGLFTVAVGLPFVAVAANAPLLQAWFARSGHVQSRDPYFLYAASNLGSLLALLGYPLVLEPVFGLKALSSLWTAGFALLAVAIGLCFGLVRKAPATAAAVLPPEVPGDSHTGTPAWRDRIGWVGLSLVPSALLTAFTTHIATDIASAPLIWVIPLSLYLATFVIVFRDRALIPPRVLLIVHLAAVLLALLQLAQTEHTTWFLTSGLGVAAFFTSALVAHRTLYEARPAASHLTEFYLWMSFGGVLGGLFAALIAPKLFTEVFEYPLLLALTLACRPGALRLSRLDPPEIERLALLIVLGTVVLFGLPWAAAKHQIDFSGWGATPVVAAIFTAALLSFWQHPMRQLLAGLMLFLAIVVQPSAVHRGKAERSYFGVYRVMLSEDKQFNVLQHGTTLHGAQRIADGDLQPISDTTPCTYYHPKGPMAASVRVVRQQLGNSVKGRYGVIGLGAGSLACHSQPGEAWRFFEIDPVVKRIASSKNFTYLAACQPNADIVIGDARLTLAKEKDESFDLLIVDAFSSDAIPMHLLTAEAITLYAAKLKPEGVGVLHISNRYLDLEGVLDATLPLVKPAVKAFVIEDPTLDAGYAVTSSTAVVFSKDQAAAGQFIRQRGARTLNEKGMRPWTDDTSDILGPFVSQVKRRLNPPPGKVAR